MGRAAAASTGLLANVVAGVGTAIRAKRVSLGKKPFGSSSRGDGCDGSIHLENDDINNPGDAVDPSPLQLYRRTDEENISSKAVKSVAVPMQAVGPRYNSDARDFSSSASSERSKTREARADGAIVKEKFPPGAHGITGSWASSSSIIRDLENCEGRGEARRHTFEGVGSIAPSSTGRGEGVAGSASEGRDHTEASSVALNSGEEETIRTSSSIKLGFSALGMASATGSAVLRGLFGGLQGSEAPKGGDGGACDETPPVGLYRRESNGSWDDDW